jgi:hypothetical protein
VFTRSSWQPFRRGKYQARKIELSTMRFRHKSNPFNASQTPDSEGQKLAMNIVFSDDFQYIFALLSPKK